MSDLNTATACKTSNGLNPPASHQLKLLQGIEFAFFRRKAMEKWIRRFGNVFEINVPFFGQTVIVSDPALARSVCAAGTEQLVNVQPNLSNLFGPGSIFALDGRRHHDRRRLLAPAFHGARLKHYEGLIEDETLRESANWPDGREFRILEPMNRITLNVILRIVFGTDGSDGSGVSDGSEMAELRRIIPHYMKLGQLIAFVPPPRFWTGRHSPWSRLHRKAFDRIVFRMIDRAEADPRLDERTDILALLLRAGRDGGTAMSRLDTCDEVLTFISAGHETTASALGWMFERLRRHPGVLADLVAEIDEGGSELRRAAILELLRVRTVLDVAGRRVSAPNFDLGRWRIPQRSTVLVRLADLHHDRETYTCPGQFDPYRFYESKPPSSAWLAFGGGARRCLGADFAITEMDVVLRTVLRHFQIQTDAAPDEKSHFRGIAHTPKSGARVVVYRRK
ncbi:cytochrome P450 [Mycobacterium gordonae]|nr:cytochrome P450 [Mycobacterium gordonae]OBJ83506.1 cytochrome P450 [Mycobacterium gordonae]